MKVQNTLFWAKITGRAHVRGGRGDFTEIKFDQIRSRCDKFGDFFAKILSFEGIFKVYFLSCFQNLFKFPIFFRMSANFFILITFFQFFEGSKHAILGKNHRQGSRSGSRSRAWTKTFFWCILKRDKDSKNPGFQDLRFRSKTSNFWVRNCVERYNLLYLYAVWNGGDRWQFREVSS